MFKNKGGNCRTFDKPMASLSILLPSGDFAILFNPVKSYIFGVPLYPSMNTACVLYL